jgi:peptidoglycan/xylan/chitin deacetylase (PgdA/CDA1 family)
MNSWLNPVVEALNERFTPLDLFFCNEDVGWVDEGLFELVDLFADHGLPLDLAVIPDAAGPIFAERLLYRLRLGFSIGVYQHGLSHINHERDGRLSEFGPSRTAAQQRADIAAGRRKLVGLLGGHVDPIFSPPWGRCTAMTGQCLIECGFPVLSRDLSEGLFGINGLTECPTRVDWFAQVNGQQMTRAEWARALALEIAATAQPVGIKLCHAVMDDEDQLALQGLLRVLSRHPNVNGILMRDAVRAPAAAARHPARAC